MTELTTPKLLGDYELGQGWSNADYDYHAFLYYDASSGILAIPYQSYTAPDFTSGLRVFTVGNAGITQRGLVQAKIINGYSDYVDRSLIIGNSIYAFAHRSATASNIDTLAVELVVDLQ